jgi:CHAT domain-containing protein/tetratricopeptide (TPR) repeat protein
VAFEPGTTPMLALLLPLTCSLLQTAAPDSLNAPATLVRVAMHAVEGDSAAALESRWKARIDRNPTDRGAEFGLATLNRLRYAYPEAERLYRQVLKGDSIGDDPLDAYALLGLAQGLDAQGFSAQVTTAIDRARLAARRVNDSSAEAEGLLILSLQRAFGEAVESGLATLDTVERLVPTTRYDLQVERLRQRAALRGMLGRPEARADAREALEVARKSGYQRAIAQALRSLAQLLQFEGKRDSSIAVLQQAEALYRRAHDRAQLATALLWHVNALLNQGDLGTADELVHQALAEGQAAGNQFSVAAGYTAEGALEISLGDYSAASRSLDRSITLFRQLGDPGGEMKARDYLAVTELAAGDIPGARQQTVEVLKWNQRIGDPLIQFSAHRNLAIIAMHEGNWVAAKQALDDAHALARRLHRPLWAAELHYDEGRLALFRGDLRTAERDLSQYLATLDSSQHVFRHDTRVKLADIYARRGDTDRAEREATQAWEELEHWRSTLSNTELRVLAFQASPTEMSDRDAGVVRLIDEIAGAGRVPAAFALAERRRARELADRLAQATALRPGSDSTQPSPEHRPQLTPISAAAVTSHIPDDSTAILEYVTGSLGSPTTLFLLTRASGIRAIELPAADSLEPQIARLEALIQSGKESASVAASLGSTLLAPAVALIGPAIRRLVIIPDGPLHRLPFDALRLQRSRFVTERYAISSAPSAGVLLRLWQRSTAPGRPMRLLAFGDPTYRVQKPTTGEPGDSSLPRLRRSAGEARLVARYSPWSEIRLHEKASATFLKHADLSLFRVVHFATHAVVDEHTAARTALVLAPGGGETGFVGPSDLSRLHLNADLVVLSSCRSGGGVLVSGEGVQGLIAPLFQAGARAVLATQWEIGDRSAVGFIQSIYRHLAQGKSVGDALRLAKLDAIRADVPPHEWAAFMIVGDPLVRVPLRAPSEWRGLRVLLVGLGALGLVLAALYFLRTRRLRSAEPSRASGAASRTHH